jgi:hypothetical protein
MNTQCDLPRLDAALDREARDVERTWATEHLGSCAACRQYAAQRAALDARLGAMPVEVHPARSLWPSIEGRLDLGTRDVEQAHHVEVRQSLAAAALHPRSARPPGVWRIAAAVALFASGYVIGTSREQARRPPGRAPSMDAPSTSSDPAQAAAEVQRLGSAWTASLARLARLDTASSSVGRQEREVALATLRGGASELMRIAPDKPGVAAAYNAIVEDHRKPGAETPASRRVTF